MILKYEDVAAMCENLEPFEQDPPATIAGNCVRLGQQAGVDISSWSARELLQIRKFFGEDDLFMDVLRDIARDMQSGAQEQR